MTGTGRKSSSGRQGVTSQDVGVEVITTSCGEDGGVVSGVGSKLVPRLVGGHDGAGRLIGEASPSFEDTGDKGKDVVQVGLSTKIICLFLMYSR